MADSKVVLELQRDALDSKVAITDLLRKALVVATKLSIEDFRAWVMLELNGYRNGAEVPDYRRLRGEVKGWNQYHGWVPVFKAFNKSLKNGMDAIGLKYGRRVRAV